MSYIKVSAVWLKVFCAPFIATVLSGGTYLFLYKTVGVPNSNITMTDQYPVEKSTLEDELKDSKWCYRITFDNGGYVQECGFKRNGKELFYEEDANNNYYSTETIKEYFSSMGAEEPPGALSLYWKGKNLYYGYYPGVSILRRLISGAIDMTLYASIVSMFLLCIYPVLIFAILIINTCSSLLNPKRKL